MLELLLFSRPFRVLTLLGASSLAACGARTNMELLAATGSGGKPAVSNDPSLPAGAAGRAGSAQLSVRISCD